MTINGFTVPYCIRLDAKQASVFVAWAQRVVLEATPEKIAEMVDEDVSMTSPFTWHAYSTGVGDVLYVTCGPHLLHLGYDDDGNILGELSADWETSDRKGG